MRTIDIAEVAPDFTLPDANDVPQHLAELCTDRPLAMVFYRGHW